jgi:hypothetical protein
MSLLSRLTKLIGHEQRMLSVSVKSRDGKFFVVTIHGCSGGGDPCIAAGPVEVLSSDVEPAELGAAVVRGLKQTRHDYRYPANPEQWKAVTAPLLSAAGCKTWAAFGKRASDLRVDQAGTKFHVLPCMRGAKAAFLPVMERERYLEAPSGPELGTLVAEELAFAAARDDLASK